MLTSVQKEMLHVLIDLHTKSSYMPIKGETIASVMDRNPGTIRNQMQYLRNRGIVRGVPGPRGGYKPTIEAYHALNMVEKDDAGKEEEHSYIPIFKNGKKLENMSVSKIEFTSISNPITCEGKINIIGSTKELNIGDEIRLGPTPITKFVVNGVVVGWDDVDGILLLDVEAVRGTPPIPIKKIVSENLITLEPDMDIKQAAWILSNNGIDGAPVIKDHEVVGILTLIDITKAIANEEKELKVADLMSKYIIAVDQDTKIEEAIEIMKKNRVGRLIVVDGSKRPFGIVTKTDFLNEIGGLKYLSF